MSFWSLAGDFFAAIVNRFAGSSKQDAVLPFNPPNQCESRICDNYFNALDFHDYSKLRLPTASLEAVCGSRTSLNVMNAKQMEWVTREFATKEAAYEDDVEETVLMESFDAKDDDDIEANPIVLGEGAYSQRNDSTTVVPPTLTRGRMNDSGDLNSGK